MEVAPDVRPQRRDRARLSSRRTLLRTPILPRSRQVEPRSQSESDSARSWDPPPGALISISTARSTTSRIDLRLEARALFTHVAAGCSLGALQEPGARFAPSLALVL
ncbi:hypothetical protein SCP_1203270 [Sparassis crispa]|uniref:Uncharacterized protein n=1 Tax=Sparassis crispa TaxID=139825 RepID=A0A401H106_9APHY|nr:hypothetical protein SCP_1203270 [Sparassis crispa]GBE88098.1 hypothetical protein SCP_1203270 [Sparassis crispa]